MRLVLFMLPGYGSVNLGLDFVYWQGQDIFSST